MPDSWWVTIQSHLALCPKLLDVLCAAGDESKVMMEAHVDAGFVVGEPFGHEGLYDFGGHGTLTKRVTQLGGVMMQHRCVAITCLGCTSCQRREAVCLAS